MRSAFKATLVLTIMLSAANTLFGQWTPLGPYGQFGYYNMPYGSFALLDSTLFVTNGEDFYASTDNGRRWSSLGYVSYANGGLYAFDTLLFCGGTEEVKVSSDHGATWKTAFGSDTLIAAASCFARIGSTLFVGIETSGYVVPCRYNTGVVRSTDNGATWMSLPSDSLKSLRALVTATSGRFPLATSRLIAAAGRSVFQSTDLGASWVKVGPDKDLWFTAMIAKITTLFDGHGLFSSTMLYAASWRDGIYASTDLGVTWTLCGNSLPGMAVSALAISGGSSDTLLAATNRGVYCLPLGGTSWQPAAGIPQENITAFHASGSTVLALGQTLGVFRSEDGGGTWTTSSDGFGGYDAEEIAFTDSATIAAGTSSGDNWGTIHYYGWTAVMRNGEPSWSISVPFYDRIYALDVVGARVYAGLYGAVGRSTDNGRTWDTVQTGLPRYREVNALVHVPSGTVVYAGTAQGVCQSTDDGSHWVRCSGVMPDSVVSSMYAQSKTIGHTTVTTLYAGTQGGNLYYSATGGTSWVDMQLPVTTSYVIVWTVFAHGSSVFAAKSYHLYRTTDYGTTWTLAETGLPQYAAVRCFASSGETLFLGCDYGGVYSSSDGGTTWHAVNTGLDNASINNLAVRGDTLYAVVKDNGLWKRPLGEMITGVNSATAELPRDLVLHQNYPNPFNPTTTICYDLPRRSHVALTVYNALGQKVGELIDGEVDGGYHTLTFDGTRLASGVYFYRIHVLPVDGKGGASVQTKALLLLK